MSIASKGTARDPGVSGRLAYSIRQATEACGLSRSALYVAIARGDLRAVKLGRRTVILEQDLARFLGALPTIGGAA
jgi:excisionase family DNA binding protein